MTIYRFEMSARVTFDILADCEVEALRKAAELLNDCEAEVRFRGGEGPTHVNLYFDEKPTIDNILDEIEEEDI